MKKLDDSDLFNPNDTIGDYVIETSIKLRTKNHVYKAFKPPNIGKEYYVVKVLPYETLNEKLKFIREQEILTHLKDYDFILHPITNIEKKFYISIHNTNEEEEEEEENQEKTFMCVIMNFCNHFDLRDFYYKTVKGENRLELRLQIFHQTLTILKNIHEKRVVHNDIKPQNFLVRNIDPIDIVLTDFEFAVELEEGEYIKTKCGTIQYMAPEVLNDQDHDMAADIWSLGVMMYKFSRSIFPFGIQPKDELEVVKEKINNNNLVFGNKFPRPLGSLIIQMLKKNPKDRITAEKALKHPYFVKFTAIEEATKERISEITEVETLIEEVQPEMEQIEGVINEEK